MLNTCGRGTSLGEARNETQVRGLSCREIIPRAFPLVVLAGAENKRLGFLWFAVFFRETGFAGLACYTLECSRIATRLPVRWVYGAS